MKKKIILLIVLVIILALAIGGVSVWTYFKDLANQVQDVQDDPEAEQPLIETYDLSIEPVDGYINILLLGVDSRDMTKMDKSRSDMIMIASINQETYDVTLTSIYRDTYLKINNSYSKITHAMMWGGPSLTIKSINENLGLNIEKYAIVNFKAVVDLVDAVGGIEVDVKQNEIEQLNKYTKATCKKTYPDRYEAKDYNLVTEPGLQTLEGVQAVSYGRIRKGVGDDFKRTERMRTVVGLVLDKVKAMPFKDIKNLISTMTSQVKTNLSLNDMFALGVDILKYDITSGSGWPYAYRCNTYKGLSYVFPYDLQTNVKDLHEKVFGQTDYQVSSTIKEYSAVISDNYAESKQSSSKENEQEIVNENTTYLRDANGNIVYDAYGNPIMVVEEEEEDGDDVTLDDKTIEELLKEYGLLDT